MQNCKLSDKDFNIFFSYLNKKTYLQDTLQYLGFSENQLSYINLKQFVLKGGNLKNLQYFDLNKNNIYEFVTDNFKALPALKVLDLTDNNITNFAFFESIYSKHKKKLMSCIVLMCNNLFISNNKENNKNYRKYLYECLPNFKYKIKKVNLSLLFNKDNNEELNILRQIIVDRGILFFRMSPNDKAKLIQLFKKQNPNNIVAMCGDGANDCSALISADVGVSLKSRENIIMTSHLMAKTKSIAVINDIINIGKACYENSTIILKILL